LRPGQFGKIVDTLDADAQGQRIPIAWIAEEKLRDVLNLRARVTGTVPDERAGRDRLWQFYNWCAQNYDIPELVSLATTTDRWAGQIVCAAITGRSCSGTS
jgi:hypothetical protein